MITSIASIVVIIVAVLIEYRFSFLVKRSRPLLHVYSIVWLVVYLGMFSLSFEMTFHPVVRVCILLVTGGLGVRSSFVYHTAMYHTKQNKDASTT